MLLQIVEDVPDVDVVVVPVGGAGLIAGVSLAVKTLKPECKVGIKIVDKALAFFPCRLIRLQDFSPFLPLIGHWC